MKRFLLLALQIVLCTFCIFSIQAKSTVAVYVQGKSLSTDEKSMISSAVLSRMSSNSNYIPYERDDSFLDAVTKEHDFQLSGEVSEKEIRSIGQMCGVDYVIVIKVTIPTYGKCNMASRMINITSGRVIKSDNYSRNYEGSYTEVLIPMANYITHRMFNQ